MGRRWTLIDYFAIAHLKDGSIFNFPPPVVPQRRASSLWAVATAATAAENDNIVLILVEWTRTQPNLGQFNSRYNATKQRRRGRRGGDGQSN